MVPVDAGVAREWRYTSLVFRRGVGCVGGKESRGGQRGRLVSSPGTFPVALAPGLVTGLRSASLLSGAQVPGVGRPRLGSASTTTPTGSWSAPTRAAWSAARASRTSGCTATLPGATALAPSSW